MRNLNTIFLLFAGVLYLTVCEAKCRGKNTARLKRSFKLAISSDKINNRHKAGIRKIFRRRRNIKEEEVMESDKFTAEIKFLQKWNPTMSKKDGSAYRLFQGNVLDAILEQMNADQRFISSRVLNLKKAPDGILAEVGFHFRKGEHNPVSHIRFIVSRGHLSSLKVDKKYFKIVKIAAQSSSDHDNETSTKEKLSNDKQNNPPASAQDFQKKPTEEHHDHNGSPSETINSLKQTKNQPTTPQESPNPATVQYPSQPQNEAGPQAQPPAATETQALNQATVIQNQDRTKSANVAQTEQPKSPEQSSNPATTESSAQNQASVLSENQDQAQSTNVAQAEKLKSQDQNSMSGGATQQQTQEASQVQSQNPIQDNVDTKVTDNHPKSTPAAVQQQANSQDAAVSQTTEQPNVQTTQQQIAQQEANPQDQTAVYQPNSYNDVNIAQTQSSSQTNSVYQNLATPKPADNGQGQAYNVQQEEQSSYSNSNNNKEDISIKMNQAWFPFLSNHDTLQYKMLAGNLEKGLKSVMGEDKNIKDIKVTNLAKADEGHTTVDVRLIFNGGKEGSTEKLRNIIKTGDVDGISVDSSFFKIL